MPESKTPFIFLHNLSSWSSELGPLTPHLQASVSPLEDPSGKETHSLAGEEMGEPNSDDWTETLVLYTV